MGAGAAAGAGFGFDLGQRSAAQGGPEPDRPRFAVLLAQPARDSLDREAGGGDLRHVRKRPLAHVGQGAGGAGLGAGAAQAAGSHAEIQLGNAAAAGADDALRTRGETLTAAIA